MDSPIIIYTDGSSVGNPGPSGWGAIILYPEGRVVELGGREDHSTNNRMELAGAIEALHYVLGSPYSVKIFTDSSYLVNGITKWILSWQKNGWITGAKEPVLNKDLWEELHLLSKKIEVEWKYTPGHSGIPGNERVDEIAQALARGEEMKLFDGDKKNYSIDSIDLLPKEFLKKEKLEYPYLSFVDGVVEKHKTWDDCKRRVEGVGGAKYKKIKNLSEEEIIIREWKD